MLRHVMLVLFFSHLFVPALAQQADLSVPPSLEVHGVPSIPVSLAKDIEKYTGAYGYSLAGWDPVKREIRVKALSNAPTIYRIESPGARQRIWKQLLVGSVYDLYPDPSERYIIYNKDNNGDEAYQMYLYDLRTYKSSLLSDPGSRNTEFVWSHTGDRVVYSRSKASEGPGVSLYIMDPRDPSTRKLLVESKGDYLKAHGWSLDDQNIVYCEYYNHNNSRLWVLNVKTMAVKLLSSKNGEQEYYGWPQFSKDGRGIYYITDKGADKCRIAYLDLATGRNKYLLKEGNWDVEEIKLSPDGRIIAYAINYDGYSRLHFLHTSTLRDQYVADIPEGVISNMVWDSSSSKVAFDFKSPRSPNDVYSVSVDTGEVLLWSESVFSSMAKKDIPLPSRIKWNSFDGKEVSGYIYRPPLKFTGKRPVIVFLHGGPTEQYRPFFGYEHNYYANELGVAWIYPNFRGSTGYGKRYEHSDDGMRREGAIRDVIALLDWVEKQPDLDSRRVIVRGASYGGYLALTLSYLCSSRLRGVISSHGISNLAEFTAQVEPSRQSLQRAEFGDERDGKMRAFLERIAPINNVGRIKIPLFVVHGMRDPMANFAGARSIADAAIGNGGIVWSIWALNEGHAIRGRDNWLFNASAMVWFVKTFLLGQG